MTATQGCIGGYQDEGWGDLIDVLMECITKEETAICATAASKALVAVLHEARCDPCFTKREFERLKSDAPRGDSPALDSAWRKRFSVCQLLGMLVPVSEGIEMVESMLGTAMEWLLDDGGDEGLVTSLLPRAACSLVLIEDYKILESSVRGPLANAAVVLAWLTGAVEGATGELCETILSGLLANSFPRLSGIILSSVVPAFIEKGVHEFEGAVEDWATAVGYGHMSHGQLEALTQFYDKFGGPGRIGCATECLRRSLMMEASIRALLAAGEVEAVVESPFPVDTVLVDRSTTMTEWQPEDLPSVVVTSVADRCMQKILTDRSLSKSDVEALLALLEKCPVSTLRDDGELQAKLQAVLEAVGEAPFNLEPPSGLCILSGLTNDGGDPSD
ncbi:26S proteasome non-ATPase regulatory subunit 7 [Perkinsus chesapeaki]|uniref:26S proteasome non-ATPase regulatory subunit 7 n=1 Tax=Perkinsus chesapeaki TaxID=330153 RepID=A0A7J6M8Q9_PERCH|nr:26S proteasome non-ATPase regulatory subunit 7 [Perkinsus chesapeaki]